MSLHDYLSNKDNVNLSSGLRRFGGEQYLTLGRHKIENFLDSLINNCDSLSDIIQQHVTTLEICKNCGSKTNVEKKINILILSVREECNNKTYDLKEIIDMNTSCMQDSRKYCSSCKKITDTQEKVYILKNNKIMFIKVVHQDNDQKKNITKPIKLKSIPSFKMKIGNYKYQVISAIFEEHIIRDKSINQVYTCMIRDNKSGLIHIQDEIIKKRSWPRNSSNALIFVLEAIT